jgi:hypothetical protein
MKWLRLRSIRSICSTSSDSDLAQSVAHTTHQTSTASDNHNTQQPVQHDATIDMCLRPVRLLFTANIHKTQLSNHYDQQPCSTKKTEHVSPARTTLTTTIRKFIKDRYCTRLLRALAAFRYGPKDQVPSVDRIDALMKQIMKEQKYQQAISNLLKCINNKFFARTYVCVCVCVLCMYVAMTQLHCLWHIQL